MIEPATYHLGNPSGLRFRVLRVIRTRNPSHRQLEPWEMTKTMFSDGIPRRPNGQRQAMPGLGFRVLGPKQVVSILIYLDPWGMAAKMWKHLTCLGFEDHLNFFITTEVPLRP